MKKNYFKTVALCATICLVSCGAHITNTAVNNNTSTTTATSAGANLGSSLLSSVLGSIINATTTFTQADLVGTWNYKSSDCKFESENFLKQAGGEIAASTIENKANGIFAKIGIKPGSFGMTFNADGSYSMNFGSKKLAGTYTFDEKTCKLTLIGMFGLTKNEVALTYSGKNNISILFDADKILKVISSVGSVSNNSTLSSITSLLSSYDGVKLGFEMVK